MSENIGLVSEKREHPVILYCSWHGSRRNSTPGKKISRVPESFKHNAMRG